jgi:hypothetical protein
MRLGMMHHEFGNEEVEFRISIPWKAKNDNDYAAMMDSLHYLQENWGIDPMTCNDSYFEEE